MNLIVSFVVFGFKFWIVFMLDGYFDGYLLVYLIIYIYIVKDGKICEKYMYGMYFFMVWIFRFYLMKKK